MISESAAPGVTPATVLRLLSPFERCFDAIDQTNGFNFSVGVSFRGTLERLRWTAAFAETQHKHPFLNAGLNRLDALATRAERVEGSAIPVTFARRTTPTEWQRVMEEQADATFAGDAAPLLRANFLEDETGFDLIVTAQHAVLDGMAVLGLIGDVLAVLSGERLTPLAVPAAAEDRLTMAKECLECPPAMDLEKAGAWQEFLASRPVRTFERHTGTRRPVLSSLRLTPAETTAWLDGARRNETTLSSALLAALAGAVRRLKPSLQESDIHFSVALDLRPYLGNRDDLVLSSMNPQGVCFYPEAEFWESARSVRPQIAAFQNLAAIEMYFGSMAEAMGLGLDSVTLISALSEQYGIDVSLTNLKVVRFSTVPEGLAVDAVWGPCVPSCIAGGIVVGAATLNGSLHLTSTSFSPVPELLETVREILARACASA